MPMISVALLCLFLATCKATTSSELGKFFKPYSVPDKDLSGLNSAAFLLFNLISADRGLPSQSTPEVIDSNESKVLRTLEIIQNGQDIHEMRSRIIQAGLISSLLEDFDSESDIDPVDAFFALRDRTNECLKVDYESQLFGKKTIAYCTACGEGQTTLSRHSVMRAPYNAQSVKSLFGGSSYYRHCPQSGCSGGGANFTIHITEYFYGTPNQIYVRVHEDYVRRIIPEKVIIVGEEVILVGEETYALAAMLEHDGIISFNDKFEGRGLWNALDVDSLRETNALCFIRPLLFVYQRQQKPSPAEHEGRKAEPEVKSLISTALYHILHKIDASIDPLPPSMQFSFPLQPHQMSFTQYVPTLGGLFRSILNILPLQVQESLSAEFVKAEKETCQSVLCNHSIYTNFLREFYLPIPISNYGISDLEFALLRAPGSSPDYPKTCIRCGRKGPHSRSPFIAKWPERLIVVELLYCKGLFNPLIFPNIRVRKELEAFVTRCSHDHRFDLYLRQPDSWMGPSGKLGIEEITHILRKPTREILLFYL